MRMRWLALGAAVVVVMAFVAVCRAGGDGAPDAETEDVESRIRIVLGMLRRAHLGGGDQGELDATYTVLTDYCFDVILLDDSRYKDALREACRKAQRAAQTPAISAAPIYEGAYDALDRVFR